MTERSDFLRKFNEAFATCDIGLLLEHVTDDICWNIVGHQTVEGKDAFGESLKEMLPGDKITVTIDKILTHGNLASLNGTIHEPGKSKTYAFCDIYEFNGFKNARIKKLTSYVIKEKNTK
jgi:ketosteroid isomerase-like protein